MRASAWEQLKLKLAKADPVDDALMASLPTELTALGVPTPTHAALIAALDAALAEHDPASHKGSAALRLVLLRGEGRHFSFGASVEEHRKEEAPAMLDAFHTFLKRLARYPVPVAALSGTLRSRGGVTGAQ